MLDKRAMAKEIRAANTWASESSILVFVDALAEYQDAQDKISKVGAVLMKDGRPIENPWLVVRDRAAKTLLASRIKTKELL